MEPPGPDVPDPGVAAGGDDLDDPAADLDRRPPAARPGPVALSAAVAATALAVASVGHVFVLGGLLAVLVATRAGALTALLVSGAVLARWGAPSLTAAGGGQAVLGPALGVGETGSAVAMGVAAVAIVLLAQPGRWYDLLPLGATAGAIAAGPSFPHDVPVRAFGLVVGVGLAFVASRLPARRVVGAAAPTLAAVAVVLTST